MPGVSADLLLHHVTKGFFNKLLFASRIQLLGFKFNGINQ